MYNVQVLEAAVWEVLIHEKESKNASDKYAEHVQ